MRIDKIFSLDQPEVFKQKLLHWIQSEEVFIWLDSNSKELEFSRDYAKYQAVLALGCSAKIHGDFTNAFEKIKVFHNEKQDFLFGYLGYDLKNDIENLSSNNFDGLGFDDFYFFQPKKIFFFEEDQVRLSYLAEFRSEIETDFGSILEQPIKMPEKGERLTLQSRISQGSYAGKLEKILEHIHRGDIYEMNFCMEFFAENKSIDPLHVYQKLNEISTPPFASFLKVKDKFLLSASPERFVKKEGQKIISQPIKGTARRSEDPNEDLTIKENLAIDPKERSENIMIVDLVRNDLSKTALKGSVRVEELCKVYTFRQVHQLISTVSSEITEDTQGIDVIRSLFPMGSMTGAPKISAMEIIEKYEETKRGLYSGAVGYLSPQNNFDFNVVIRSIFYNASNKYVSFSVGGAITAQSVIEREYEECLLKASAMKRALEN